jgi:YD repeat-containing protein
VGQSESYGYDPAGNLTSRKDFNGHTTVYQYDPMNRLQSKNADAFFSTGTCAAGACGATQVSFTYTATGKRKTMQDAGGATTYTYDPQMDRLLTKAAPRRDADLHLRSCREHRVAQVVERGRRGDDVRVRSAQSPGVGDGRERRHQLQL